MHEMNFDSITTSLSINGHQIKRKRKKNEIPFLFQFLCRFYRRIRLLRFVKFFIHIAALLYVVALSMAAI